MMLILTKREYDELVQKATAADLLAEQKAEDMKKQIKADLAEACKQRGVRTAQELADVLLEILRHY